MSCATGIPQTSTSPAAAAQAPATTAPGRPTKPPHGYHVNVRSPPSPEPRQRRNLAQEEELHSDTAVDTTAAGSSEPFAFLPKDNDDNGSEYAASSDEEDPVPAKRCRESARLRGVRAPSESISASVHESRDLISVPFSSQLRTCRALRLFLKDTPRATPGENARAPGARSPCSNARFWSRPVVDPDVAPQRGRQNLTLTVLLFYESPDIARSYSRSHILSKSETHTSQS